MNASPDPLPLIGATLPLRIDGREFTLRVSHASERPVAAGAGVRLEGRIQTELLQDGSAELHLGRHFLRGDLEILAERKAAWLVVFRSHIAVPLPTSQSISGPAREEPPSLAA